MILIPSRGRPLSLKRFLFYYCTTGATEPGTVLLDRDDAHNYENIGTPPGWQFVIHGDRAPITEITNRGMSMYPDSPYYGVLADDVIPHTDQWDKKLKDACIPNGVSWGDDGIHGEGLCSHMFMGGDLARAQGYISWPGVKAWCADNLWMDMAKALGTAKYLRDVKIEHMHPSNGKAANDPTYEEARPHNQGDVEAYQRYHNSGAFVMEVHRVRDNLSRKAARCAR